MTEHPHKQEEKKEDPRALIAQYQNYESQLKTVLEEIKNIENTIIEHNLAIEAMENIHKNQDADMLVPLGANSFAYAKLSDNKHIITGIGSDILVKKSVTESRDMVKDNLKGMQKNIENLSSIAKNLEAKLIELTPKIQPYLRR